MNPINRINPALRVCACVLALLVSACSEQPDSVDEAPGPNLIVINADVRTVDSTMPNAEAFAVIEGKFVAVGSTGEIQDLARENTDVIDAGDVVAHTAVHAVRGDPHLCRRRELGGVRGEHLKHLAHEPMRLAAHALDLEVVVEVV